MNYCKRCVMPSTRPGLIIDSEGICSACRHAEQKESIDWQKRERQFQAVCDFYKRKSEGEHDCIIAVSSGKDSFYQVHKLKEYGMNPLLVSVDNLDWSQTGLQNRETMMDTFNCEMIVHKSSKNLNRKISRLIFEKDGFISWYFDRLIYTYPLHMAIKFNIPLVIYGENTSYEYGGPLVEETPYAIEQINNDAVRDYGWKTFTDVGISMDELVLAQAPTMEEIIKAKLSPQYLSYYFRWSGFENMQFVKKFGWKSLDDTKEWKREGYIEDYDQIDDIAYCVDPLLKYPKLGHARATDVASIWIREGRITREEGIKLVKEHDHKMDPLALVHYLDFAGYSEEEFWEIYNKFRNKDLFEKKDNKWQLKNPIWKQ